MTLTGSDELAPWRIDVGGGGTRAPLNSVLNERLTEVQDTLRDHGVVLVRGADVEADARRGLLDAVSTVSGLEPEPYAEQSAPRTAVGDGVYTTTDYPAHTEIFLHNELSYANRWPRFLFFYCVQPAAERGQTTVADCRQVYEELPSDVRAEFEARSWMYVRNLRGTSGLDWRTVFQTTSRSDVEAYCAANRIEVTWTSEGVRLRAVRPATLEVSTPRGTGPVWFNHIASFHISTLPTSVSRSLRRIYDGDALPVNTYYGDGAPIPDETVAEIRDAYRRVTLDMHWRQGDLAIVDNHRVAHGRRPYSGTRKVLVVLAGEGHREEAAGV